jgi:hypothetical protein
MIVRVTRSLIRSAIALLFGVSIAQAQSTAGDTAVLPPIAGFSIQGGGMRLDSDAMNAQLASRGRAQLRKTIGSIGVESWMRWNRVMLIANSQTYFPTRSPATNFTTEMSGGVGLLSIGVPIILARTTLIYPTAGVGLSNTTVTLRRNGSFRFDSSFRDIPANGGRNVDISGRRYQANFGLGIDQIFQPSWPDMLMSIGLRAGYAQPFGDTKWKSGTEDVIGAPEIGLRGAYVRLSIGGVLGKRRYASIPMVGALIPYFGR